jgi:hypothetical protein
VQTLVLEKSRGGTRWIFILVREEMASGPGHSFSPESPEVVGEGLLPVWLGGECDGKWRPRRRDRVAASGDGRMIES